MTENDPTNALAFEDEYIGEESHLVPKIDPGEYCNGKKTITIQGSISNLDYNVDQDLLDAIVLKNDFSDVRDNENRTFFKGYCKNTAGRRTDHSGEGRCKFHDAPGGVREGAGAPKHNQNGTTKAMAADPHHYAENLPHDEEMWIERVTAEILDRVRRIHGRDVDFLDRTLARLVTIELHIVYQATDYTKDELVQVIIHDGSSHEEPGALVEEVRRYANDIFQNLKRLGVMEDPESKQASAIESWGEMLDAGENSDQEIEIEIDDDA